MVKVQAAAAVAAVSVACLVGCTTSSGEPVPEPTPEFSVTPAAWADYEREKLTPDDCPDFAADAAQELLGSKDQPWVFDVIREVSKADEVVYAQCSFSDPQKVNNQVVFQMNRIEHDDGTPDPDPLILVIMHRLKSKSPLNERYPGFGNNTKVGEYGGQTAMWACGNQWLSVSVQQGATEQKDQAALLWKHFEPAIQRHCGTVEKPAVPLAVDDKDGKGKNPKRPDLVAGFVRHENLDLPTTESASTAVLGPRSGGHDLPKSSGHLESIERCDMFSATEAVQALGVAGRESEARGDRQEVWDVFGRNGECSIRIEGKDSSTAATLIGSRFEQYSKNFNVRNERLEAVADVHSEPVNRGPYVGKYRGFGVIDSSYDKEQRRVTWLCGSYFVEGWFEASEEIQHIDDADLWALTEPTIRRICGRPDEPMTQPLGSDLRRVDYTQLLMEDWKIGTDVQLFEPPEKKRYLRPPGGATING